MRNLTMGGLDSRLPADLAYALVPSPAKSSHRWPSGFDGVELDDDIWDIKFNFPGQDNLERKLSRSDITVLNLLSLIESYGYGIRDNMYYVKEKGRGVEGMELIDSMGKIVEMLALNEAEHGAIITVLKKNSVWPAGFNMEADEAEVLDVPVKFSVDNNGVNYISENEEFVPVAIDLTDVLYVGTQQSCNVPKGMQVPVDIMSDDEDAFFYPCQYNLEERNRLVAEEYELMHKLKRPKKEKEPDEEVVQIMHKLDEERKRRSNPAMHYEGDTDVEEIYEEEEEESDGDEAPELEYFEKEYSFEKKQPLNPGPTSRSHYETLEYQCEDFVPSSDEDNSPGDVGDSDDDGFTKKHKLPCGRKRKLKKLKKRVWNSGCSSTSATTSTARQPEVAPAAPRQPAGPPLAARQPAGPPPGPRQSAGAAPGPRQSSAAPPATRQSAFSAPRSSRVGRLTKLTPRMAGYLNAGRWSSYKK
ncbi:hypothetical protein ACQ4PT_062089 [Festuca glaucescens]